jgi:murein DD-endopeptidase MepM/ murein hydrolase activator NlpD
MRYFPIGFHAGSGGNLNGIGQPDGYMPTLSGADIPFNLISADSYGVVGEGTGYSGNNNLAFRMTDIHEVPMYGTDPHVAALTTWQGIRASLPQEFDKEKVWIVIWNEPRKEAEWGDWLGETAYEISQLTLADGYKAAFFGYSSGTPDFDTWFTPGMVKFLRLAAQHPEHLAVSLHEYSFTTEDIFYGSPYLVGRFEFLHEACDEQQIGRPTILITEFGWEYNNIPDSVIAMDHIMQAADLYAVHPNIFMANIWYSGAGFGNIDDQVQELFVPVTEAALTYVPPDPVDPPPIPPEESLEQYLWDLSIERQPISLNANAALQSAMFNDGLTPVESEEWTDYNNVTYSYQAAEDPAGVIPRRVYAAEVPTGDMPWSVFWFSDPADEPVEPPPGTFELTHWPCDSRVVTQYFAENPQNYNMYCDPTGLCLPGHNGWDMPAEMGAPFYAAVSGEVIWVSDTRPSGGPSDYGWHIRVRTGDYIIIYAHAAPHPPVSVGDWVVGGQVIAASGNTGRSTGPHLHFEMRNCDLSEPEWPWCIIDCSPYLEPLRPDDPPVGNLFDMLPYFHVVPVGNGPFFVLQHHDGRTEDIQHQIEYGDVLIVKNRNYERLRVTASHVERREDTSPQPGQYYVLDDGYGWSRWCPRYWRINDVFYRAPDVRFYTKDTCQQLSEDLNVDSVLTFLDYFPTWTSPSGITLSDVIQLGFSWSPGGPLIEVYWYAKNIGMVQWHNDQGAHSWVSEIPLGRDPLEREVIHCL